MFTSQLQKLACKIHTHVLKCKIHLSYTDHGNLHFGDGKVIEIGCEKCADTLSITKATMLWASK